MLGVKRVVGRLSRLLSGIIPSGEDMEERFFYIKERSNYPIKNKSVFTALYCSRFPDPESLYHHEEHEGKGKNKYFLTMEDMEGMEKRYYL